MPSFNIEGRIVVARSCKLAIRKYEAVSSCRRVTWRGFYLINQVNRKVAALIRAHFNGKVRWHRGGVLRYDVHGSDGAYVANQYGAIFLYDGHSTRLIAHSWPEARKRIYGLWGIWVPVPSGIGGKWS